VISVDRKKKEERQTGIDRDAQRYRLGKGRSTKVRGTKGTSNEIIFVFPNQLPERYDTLHTRSGRTCTKEKAEPRQKETIRRETEKKRGERKRQSEKQRNRDEHGQTDAGRRLFLLTTKKNGAVAIADRCNSPCAF